MIDSGTFLVPIKGSLRLLCVAVDLPAADALCVVRLILDETPDVLARITEEQPDLVREFVRFTQTLDQLCHTLLTTVGTIAAGREQTAYIVVLKITAELRRAVNIDQYLAVMKPKRQQAHALVLQRGIPFAKKAENLSVALIMAVEQIACFQSRQGRRAMLDQHFL